MDLRHYIDHTLLRPDATQKDIARLCKEAIEHQFYAVCINPGHLAFAKAQLQNSAVKLATVVGFPLGASTTAIKVYETRDAINRGADEIDMVINIGALKEGDYSLVNQDIKEVREAAEGKVLKVIFENCYLSDEEKRIACRLCLENEVDYIKTSTGFGSSGATYDDVHLMKAEVGDQLKIKASGGIRDRLTAEKYIELGADRIGTSSAATFINT